MKHKNRKQKLLNKLNTSCQEEHFLSRKTARQLLETEYDEPTSEDRIDLLNNVNSLISRVFMAAQDLITHKNLEIKIAKRVDEIPYISNETEFKYSYTGDDGCLVECKQRIVEGEDICVALVCEDSLIIGYGIAVTKNKKCKVEIVDVDRYSRRESGLFEIFQFSGQNFQVGVGHVLVKALMDNCQRPIYANATNSSSRYIFKSLGFIHNDRNDNPCILMLT